MLCLGVGPAHALRVACRSCAAAALALLWLLPRFASALSWSTILSSCVLHCTACALM